MAFGIRQNLLKEKQQAFTERYEFRDTAKNLRMNNHTVE
jgi:hypothetical protein